MNGLLNQILAALKQLGIVMLSRLGLIDLNMQQLLGDVDLVKSQVQLISTAVTTLTTNVATVQATVDIITIDLGADTTLILAAIGTPQQSGVAVTLPTTPPAGYGGASAGAVATSVWLAPITLASGAAAGDVLAWSGVPGFLRGSVEGRIDYGFAPGWLVTTEWNNLQLAVDTTLPAIDWTTIVPADATPTAWADRVYSGFSPYSTDSLGRPFFNDGRPGAGYVYTIDMTSEHFRQLRGSGSSVVVAPVWPGIAGVTLGGPVPLSPTCVVTGPMHGVIIDITSAAPRQIYQVFGGMQGYRFVGGLQFVDDNGEAERIQSIGMQHEVILCKSMAEAASCSIRTDSAVAGTATPFVIT